MIELSLLDYSGLSEQKSQRLLIELVNWCYNELRKEEEQDNSPVKRCCPIEGLLLSKNMLNNYVVYIIIDTQFHPFIKKILDCPPPYYSNLYIYKEDDPTIPLIPADVFAEGEEDGDDDEVINATDEEDALEEEEKMEVDEETPAASAAAVSNEEKKK